MQEHENYSYYINIKDEQNSEIRYTGSTKNYIIVKRLKNM